MVAIAASPAPGTSSATPSKAISPKFKPSRKPPCCSSSCAPNSPTLPNGPCTPATSATAAPPTPRRPLPRTLAMFTNLPAMPIDKASNRPIAIPRRAPRSLALLQNSGSLNNSCTAASSFKSTPDDLISSSRTLPNSIAPDVAPTAAAPAKMLPPVTTVAPVAATRLGIICGRLSPTTLRTAPGLSFIARNTSPQVLFSSVIARSPSCTSFGASGIIRLSSCILSINWSVSRIPSCCARILVTPNMRPYPRDRALLGASYLLALPRIVAASSSFMGVLPTGKLSW